MEGEVVGSRAHGYMQWAYKMKEKSDWGWVDRWRIDGWMDTAFSLTMERSEHI